MKILFYFIFTCVTIITYAQKAEKKYLVYWSDENRLSRSDFTIKKTDSTHDTFGAAFTTEYRPPIFQIKNLNNYLYSCMLKNVSWIDTSSKFNVEKQIDFLQDLFDIWEIYNRRLRKKVSESLFDIRVYKEFYHVYLEEAIKRQQEYKSDILYNPKPDDISKLLEWKITIKQELDSLNKYQPKIRRP